MRTVTGWPTDTTVTEPAVTVTVGGAPADPAALSVTREVPSHLPNQVTGRGGLTAATGSLDWAPDDTVTPQVPTPWSGGTPLPGEPVAIDAGTPGAQARVFTGVIDDSTGSLANGQATSGVVDAIDQLSKSVTIRPLARIMPSPTTDGNTVPRNIGLVSTYFVNRVLRECGFNSTPPMAQRCVFSAPLQGSTWPERGEVRRSARAGTWVEQPYFGSTWHGVAGRTLFAEYTPDLSTHNTGDLTRPLEILFSAGNYQMNSGRIECLWGNARISVSVTSSKSIVVQFMFPTNPGVRTTVLSATTGTLGSWRHASVRVEPNGNRTAAVRIRTNNGGAANLNAASLPYGVEHTPMQSVTLDFNENNIGGVQVAFPANASNLQNFTPTADLTAPAPLVSLVGSPAIINTPAIDLLRQWSEAECAAMWIDEDGVFRWRNRNSFLAGAQPVWEGTSLDNLIDLSWSHSVQGTTSAVTTKYKRPAPMRANRSRITVWQGGGDTIETGDELEEFVQPPSDETWINVDSTPDVFQSDVSKQAFNKGWSTWVGCTAYDKDGDPITNQAGVNYVGTVTPMGWDTWRVYQTVTSAPSAADTIKLETLDGPSSVLKPQWQGFKLPVLRAQLRLTWSDESFRGTFGGPAWAPELTHDTDWWVQDPSAVQDLTYWLAQQTAKPLPVVEDLRIVPDARLQLGDKIRVTDTHRSGLTITGVITAINHQISTGQHTMSVRLLVTVVEARFSTLAQYDQVWGGATLLARDTEWKNQSLAAFDAYPTRRT